MDKETVAVIQQSVADLGVTAKIGVMEWGAFLSAMNAGEPPMGILGWSQAAGVPLLPMYSENLIYAANAWDKGYNHSPAGFRLNTVLIENEILCLQYAFAEGQKNGPPRFKMMDGRPKSIYRYFFCKDKRKHAIGYIVIKVLPQNSGVQRVVGDFSVVYYPK